MSSKWYSVLQFIFSQSHYSKHVKLVAHCVLHSQDNSHCYLGDIVKKCPSKYDALCPSKHVNHKQAPVPPYTQRANILVTMGAHISGFMKLIPLSQSYYSKHVELGAHCRLGNVVKNVLPNMMLCVLSNMLLKYNLLALPIHKR